MKDIGWNLAGEKCLTRVDPGSNFRGVHVFLVNYERNVFKSQRAELEYDQAPALEKYINVNQMYWESIAVYPPSPNNQEITIVRSRSNAM
jgi:hypothetical protein